MQVFFCDVTRALEALLLQFFEVYASCEAAARSHINAFLASVQ